MDEFSPNTTILPKLSVLGEANDIITITVIRMNRGGQTIWIILSFPGSFLVSPSMPTADVGEA